MNQNLPTFQLTTEGRQKAADLKAKHKREVYPLRVEGRLLYVAEPTPMAMDCYMYEQLDDEKKGQAAINLLKGCAVEPEEDGLVKMFVDRPALLYAVALNFLRVVGIRAEVSLGK
jgi:hypothetical protein